MPHVVFGERVDLGDYSARFRPVFRREPHLVRISDIYVNGAGQTALLPSVAIDGACQQYLIEISTAASKTTIRLYPGTDPQKTGAVKSSMALLARQMMDVYPDLRVARTNIGGYLKAVAPA